MTSKAIWLAAAAALVAASLPPLYAQAPGAAATVDSSLYQGLHWRGIGLAVPPSYVTGLSDGVIRKLDAFDRRVAHWPGLRGFADHRFLVFVRNSSCR